MRSPNKMTLQIHVKRWIDRELMLMKRDPDAMLNLSDGMSVAFRMFQNLYDQVVTATDVIMLWKLLVKTVDRIEKDTAPDDEMIPDTLYMNDHSGYGMIRSIMRVYDDNLRARPERYFSYDEYVHQQRLPHYIPIWSRCTFLDYNVSQVLSLMACDNHGLFFVDDAYLNDAHGKEVADILSKRRSAWLRGIRLIEEKIDECNYNLPPMETYNPPLSWYTAFLDKDACNLQVLRDTQTNEISFEAALAVDFDEDMMSRYDMDLDKTIFKRSDFEFDDLNDVIASLSSLFSPEEAVELGGDGDQGPTMSDEAFFSEIDKKIMIIFKKHSSPDSFSAGRLRALTMVKHLHEEMGLKAYEIMTIMLDLKNLAALMMLPAYPQCVACKKNCHPFTIMELLAQTYKTIIQHYDLDTATGYFTPATSLLSKNCANVFLVMFTNALVLPKSRRMHGWMSELENITELNATIPADAEDHEILDWYKALCPDKPFADDTFIPYLEEVMGNSIDVFNCTDMQDLDESAEDLFRALEVKTAEAMKAIEDYYGKSSNTDEDDESDNDDGNDGQNN